MKSNCFLCPTAIVLIAHIINWILLTPKNLSHWWRTFLAWHRNRQRKRRYKFINHTPIIKMYEFRPFELTRCEYKSYAKSTSIGRGINFIPKPRSGHRVTANETDLFSFGGEFFTEKKNYRKLYF